MTANMYSEPALAQFINTYAPINFGELFRIGAAQKEEMDRAAQLFGSQLQKFGEFKSQSGIDTENYYNQTTGRKDMQEAITQMASNPEYMKDAQNRANLQSMINSVDYAGLSKLKQNAENLDKRAQVIALMKASGKYNQEWDDIDIAGWDTSKQGIMTELAPTEFMTANQLSNPYFDNLKASTLGGFFKDGVKYLREGITYDNLKDIASARFNDLIASPQGLKYYEHALRQSGGDENRAKEEFTTMIANSQMDRIQHNDQIDPYWLAAAKQSGRGSGGDEIVKPQPTRLDFLNDTVFKSVNKSSSENIDDKYKNYISSLVTKYPGTKIAKDAEKGLKNIESKQRNILEYSVKANAYKNAFEQTGNDEYYIGYVLNATIANNEWKDLTRLGNKHILRGEFERVSGFSPISAQKNQNFSHSKYMDGVKSALDIIKGNIDVSANDPLLTSTGGKPVEIVNEDGTKETTLKFDTTAGFLLPETVFNLMSESNGRNIKRSAGLFRSGDFPVRELIESGSLKNAQFSSDRGIIKIGDNFALSGKIRIPKSEIEKHIDRGMWAAPSRKQYDSTNFPTTVQSINTAIRNLFGGDKVVEKIGEDGVEYYELDTYKVIPSDRENPEMWLKINQSWQGGKGIGGTSQAKEAYMDSAEQLLN